ncbi:GH92 family glycosyl hydrolase [Rapidithrix thailandica]|uniref:GH92 family glycosyl hydrolase n=1 Tax=Rapidithrix thailandica TaxID=413964 RepID=A0AAW9S9Q8_9BACT
MKLTSYTWLLLTALFMACQADKKSGQADSPTAEEADFMQYVDPFIGTDGIVHTFPGATYPYGMIQLSPDGDTKGWNWCSGYHYSDENIKGFSHTHLSGTGWSDLGDILLMPTVGELKLNSGPKNDPDAGYRSRISHDDESATAGYYQVKLLDYDINAELTTTPRVGFHRYTFPESKEAHVIIDPTSIIFGKTQETHAKITDEQTIEGYCHSSGWGGNRFVYFTARFSKPFQKAGVSLKDAVLENEKEAKGADAKAFASFETQAGESIEVKVAISAVSLEGARKNFAAEGSNKNFDQVKQEAAQAWRTELAKVQVKGGSEEQKKIFYTGMYHAMIDPNLSMDVDGQYVAIDKTLKAEGFNNYSTFSVWDTHRAVHPLLTLIDHQRTADFVNSLVSRHAEGGQLPIWELCGFDNRCMVGYPSVSVIADAIMKEVPGIDVEKAYAAMRAIAFHPKPTDLGDPGGLEEYLELGYVSADVPQSVSKTMEFSYYDWCIGKVAEKLGKAEDAKLFFERSKNFMKHYHPERQLYWPKDRNGNWVEGISLTDWEDLKGHYVSGNIWAYSYYYPHATNMAIELMGGKEAFAQNLDKLFAEPMNMEGEQHVDISGFIGHYGHGDEPGHQITYLYNYVGQPWKTQERVSEVMKTMYAAKPDGMPNNDDCGQMSVWYNFSAIGFYPVCPGDSNYILGAPKFDETVFQVATGKTFTVKAEGLSAENVYVQSVKLNGKEYPNTYITHQDIMNGGELVFVMGQAPSEWGTSAEASPLSALQ